MTDGQPFDDKALLSRIADADQEAFNMLFARYRARLFHYLVKITKSREAAEEMVLDVFLKIWTGRAIIGDIGNFEAFLFRVARNKALDFLRWAQKSRLQQLEIWYRMQGETAAAPADQPVLYGEVRAALDHAVASLSGQRRAVFQLSREHGLTYEQIAEQLNLSTHTVRNHLAAALRFIRAHLGTELKYMILLWSLWR